MPKGYLFPLTVRNGTLALAEGNDYYRSQVLSILKTQLNERVGARSVGIEVNLFGQPSLQTAESIRATLKRHIPDLASLAVTVEYSDLGETLVTVTWSVDLGDTETITVPITPLEES